MITDLYYWVFLCVGVLVSLIISEKHRFGFYTVFSLGFMVLFAATTEPVSVFQGKNILYARYGFIFELLFAALCVYFCCKYLLHKRYWRVVQFSLIVGVFSYLGYYKYLPVLLQYVAGRPVDTQLILPLGISYFSFKLMHYLIEQGRGNFQQHSISQFFTYMFLFPILSAGPIERFDHFQNNWLSADRKQDIVEGGTRIIYGLIKKFVISGIILTGLFNHNTTESVLLSIDTISQYKVWGFFVLTYLIIYIDFSAYSDIAIGSARLLGFRIMENFNWPILATNIAQLWRRWHMTLSNWCQSYVYLPSIGATRNPYLAVIATFLAVGLWHGGAFSWVAWGLYQGFGVSVYVAWSRWIRKKKIKLPTNMATRLLAMAATNFWMAGSFIFTATYTDGSWSNITDAFRLLQKYFFLV